jgi:hypothetical protein
MPAQVVTKHGAKFNIIVDEQDAFHFPLGSVRLWLQRGTTEM